MNPRRSSGRCVPIVVLISLCLAVVGCGRDASPAIPSGLDPLQPSMPAYVPSATPGVPVGDVKALISMPWKLAAISDDRRTITVSYVGGDGYCIKHEGYQLTQDGSSLRLGEYSSSTGDRTCPASLQLGLETIRLPVALDGTVQLIHVPASEQWPEMRG